MSEYDKLVKWLTKIADHSPYLALGSNHLAKVGEAAQAIERLERERDEALGVDASPMALATMKLADARAEIDDIREAISAARKVLPTQRKPHPDDDLQKLVNLACSFLDDVLTDYAPPAPSLVECDACGGGGQIDPGSAAACPICDGAGKVTPDKNELPAPSTGEAEQRINFSSTCTKCDWRLDDDGSNDHPAKCPRCGGEVNSWSRQTAAQKQEQEG